VLWEGVPTTLILSNASQDSGQVLPDKALHATSTSQPGDGSERS
jgi:hypothetical protein